MKSEKIKFKNSLGHELAAKIEFPDGEPKAYALFAHCFTCNKNLTAVRNISHSLNECGIAVLRFDFTGLGESEGDFENTNFSSNVSDLVSAAQFLSENYSAPSILIGHSLGGAAVVFAALQIPSVKALATLGAPSNPKHVSHLLKSGLAEIQEKGEAVLMIGGREFKIQKQFLDDINEKNMEETLKNLRIALLVLHSPQDTTVGIDNAAQIYKAAWHPKSFISLDGADHLLSKKEDSIYAGKMIANWAERYINV
ncbi:alpha/beta hydrolase family protein [Ancylomarina sp. YFZ004]